MGILILSLVGCVFALSANVSLFSPFFGRGSEFCYVLKSCVPGILTVSFLLLHSPGDLRTNLWGVYIYIYVCQKYSSEEFGAVLRIYVIVS